MRYVVTQGGHPHVVELGPGNGGSRTFVLDGEPHQVHAVSLPGGVVSLVIDGQSYDMDFERAAPSDPLDPRVNVRVRGEVFQMEVLEQRKHQLRATASRGAKHDGPATVTSPMPGKVVKLLREVGAAVAVGDGVVVVEAMKMENELKSPTAGVLKEIRCKEGQAVEAGTVLVVVG
ncbi:MAG: acetyl-CoA carboxylase biotin carboxyl carrier protein subunit [Deltaproteobacteria bacterium]|nr:acetyl-CoA carboxylase biotin carboxyl carrier protein subunit [Deltaproteobacteria bacterium]